MLKEAGEEAIFEAGIPALHPEIIKKLGRLKFRHSYSQNILKHSIEMGHIMGMMASRSNSTRRSVPTGWTVWGPAASTASNHRLCRFAVEWLVRSLRLLSLPWRLSS